MIKKTALEINQTIVLNILKMLERRGLIKNHKEKYESIKPTDITMTIFNFEKISINIITSVISSIPSKSILDDYLSSKLDVKKFIIFREPSKKLIKQINTYPNVEYFTVLEMMEDIPSKHFIPEHSIVTDKDKKELDERYGIKNLPIILTTDFMARYYNAKIGDVMRIDRLNKNTGKSIVYRQVKKGNLDYIM